MRNAVYQFILLLLLTPLSFSLLAATANSKQPISNHDQIRQTLNDYIQGTSYNRPQQIEKAFYKDSNLLLQKKGQDVWRVSAKEYISWFASGQAGRFTGRIGEILAIDVAGDIASAKVEILIPGRKLRYTDLFLLRKLSDKWQIISKTAAAQESIHHGKRILFIVSSAHYHGALKKPAGASFSEIVNAYHQFKQAGYTVDFVSPDGGAIALSYINTSNELQKHYLYDRDFMYAIKHTKTPTQIIAKNYKAVHYIGGGSAMYGVASNKAIGNISMEIYEKHNGIISAVCHGTAGIVHLKTSDGQYLVKDKRITGYPEDYENKSSAHFKQFPFLIRATIEQHQGLFSFGPRNQAFLQSDDRVITGQNYLSSAPVAQKIIEMLNAQQTKT